MIGCTVACDGCKFILQKNHVATKSSSIGGRQALVALECVARLKVFVGLPTALYAYDTLFLEMY